MTSPLSLLRAGPPPPRAVLLPDGLFFVRAVDVSPDPAAGDVAAQVALALEAVSPFPLAQLYYGYFSAPGANRALVFAAYRRRFTADLVATWGDAEYVLPAFAAILGGKVEPATTVLLASPEGLTAIHWPDGGVPSEVRFRPIAIDVTEEFRARVRDELLRSFESKAIVDLAGPPVAAPSQSDQEVVFHCGEFTSALTAEAADALDVRDKDELLHLRRERARSILAWRAIMGCLALAALLVLGEILLGAGHVWQNTRETQFHAQEPVVAKIMTAQSLADRINELAHKQLLPLEMIGAIVGEKGERKPESIVFTRAATSGQNMLTVDAQTDNTGDVGVYEDNLKALPILSKVDFKPLRAANNITNFSFSVTFKPGALKPWIPPPPPPEAPAAEASPAEAPSSPPAP